MSKKTKKVFSFCALCLGLFFANSALAGEGVSIEFESKPLFNDANFLPGNTVIRWIKVTNNTAETKSIATQAVNYSGDDLSRGLDIIITEKDGANLYSKTLLDFYNEEEITLSNINPGDSKEYDFEISFAKDAGNDWQGKTTSFDILVGYSDYSDEQPNEGPQGSTSGSYAGYSEEGGGNIVPTGGGGAGAEPEVKGVYTEKPVPPAREPRKKDRVSDVLNPSNLNEIVPSLTASLGDALNKPNSYCWLLIILIIILILLFFISIRKGKIEEKRALWLLPILIIALLVIYYICCPFAKIIIALIVILSLIVYILLMKKA